MDDLYLALQSEPPPGRPHVAVNMVMSLDGTVALDGRSGPIGGPADRLAFRRLRERADAIMVGAGTARAEDYGPPSVRREGRRRRRDRGQPPRPQLVVVSGRAALDPGARLFSDPDRPPLVITTTGSDTGAFDGTAELVRAGEDTTVDLEAALRTLRDRGVEWLLVEGGPELNGNLAAADLIDELFVTLAPSLAGGRPGLLDRRLEDAPRPLELVELHRRGDEVLLRYQVAAAGQ